MAVAAAALREPGIQEPRIRSAPPASLEGRGLEAVEVAARAGLELDRWQQDVLVDSLKVRDGKWASFEVGVCVGRQNGKGAILEARELAGLFCWGEQLIIHSAQQFDTSKEAFNRLLWLIEDTPEFDQQVRKVSNAHGDEGIKLKSGQRIRYKARGKGSGRGFTADCIVLDEAMFVATSSHAALLPTLSAVPNPQIWYMGSAVDQLVMDHGLVFSRVRERATGEGRDNSLAYFEWSLDFDSPSDVPDDVMQSEEARRQTNPAYGIRITEDYLDAEYDALDPRALAVERFGVGDWPDSSGLAASPVSAEAWARLKGDGHIGDEFVVAFDVSPLRKTSIAVAGRRIEDVCLQVEIPEHRDGTGWLVDALLTLAEKNPVEFVCDGYGPAASLVPEIEEAGLTVRTTNVQEHGQACGTLLDLVDEEQVRHLGSLELLQAIRGAKTRPLGDAWAWSRKNSAVDISPLVAATLALAGAAALPDDSNTIEIF